MATAMSNKGLLTDVWGHAAHPGAAEAQSVTPTGEFS